MANAIASPNLCCKEPDRVRLSTRSIDRDIWVCLTCKQVVPKDRKLKSITPTDVEVLIEFAIALRDHHEQQKDPTAHKRGEDE